MFPRIIHELPGGQTAVYAWFQAMYTRIDILLKSASLQRDNLVAVVGDIHSLIHEIESEGNCFAPASLLSQFNSLPVGAILPGGKYLSDILSLCRQYNLATDGIFDVSVESENYHPGMLDNLVIHPDGRLERRSASLKINLSGFIKGYALDCIGALLRRHGICDAIVNMGNSSIMAFGDVPVRGDKPFLTTTGNSSDAPRRIVDPRTGAVVTRHGAISVYTDSGAEGEVKATQLFILSAD